MQRVTPEQRIKRAQSKCEFLDSFFGFEDVIEPPDWLPECDRLLPFIEHFWHILEPGRKFIPGYPVEAICAHLEAVTAGEITKLIINVPPGCMKSLTCNVFWPAWEWGAKDMPWLRYLAFSYSEKLTIRDNVKCRRLIQSDLYQQCYGDRVQIVGDQSAKEKFETTQTGFKIASSVKGTGTGERADRLLLDDPNNVKDAESEAVIESTLQFFTEVLPTRINEAGVSATVVIQQRTNERDVSGYAIAKELGYEVFCLPMEYQRDHPIKTTTTIAPDPRTEDGDLLWPARYSRDYLENDLKPTLRAWGGEYAVAGQLQQRPAPREGGMFQRKDFQIVDSAPELLVKTVRGWDLASTDATNAAFTAGVKMGKDKEGRIFILDVVRGQWSPFVRDTNMKSCAESDRCWQSIPQDPGQAGKSQKADFARLLHGHKLRFSPESGDKVTRAKPFSSQCEAGNVFVVRGNWNDAYINECCGFPRGQFKDQVDASSRAYMELIGHRVGVPGKPTVVQMG